MSDITTNYYFNINSDDGMDRMKNFMTTINEKVTISHFGEGVVIPLVPTYSPSSLECMSFTVNNLALENLSQKSPNYHSIMSLLDICTKAPIPDDPVTHFRFGKPEKGALLN